jgi:hypothetical protein
MALRYLALVLGICLINLLLCMSATDDDCRCWMGEHGAGKRAYAMVMKALEVSVLFHLVKQAQLTMLEDRLQAY